MPRKSSSSSSTSRRRKSGQKLSGPGLIIALAIVGLIYLLDLWQTGDLNIPGLPQPPVAAEITETPQARQFTRVPTLARGEAGAEPAGAEPAGGESAGGSLQVYFTDPLSGVESGGLPDLLVEAIDGAQRTVDLAIYNISLEDVADALIRAKDRGVQVRMVMESEAMDNRVPTRIAESGIPIVGDQRQGLMHNKFLIIDNEEVWMGSMNFTGAAAYRDFNNLVRIRAQRAVQNYTVEFNEMFVEDLFGATDRPATPYPQVTVDGIAMEFYFSPDDGVAAQIVEEIQGAEQSIHFLAYSYTSDPIAEAMREQLAQGVSVQGVFDESQTRSNQGGEFEPLLQAGADVRLDGISGLMHHKVIVIDGRTVITGSYNFSNNAERSNDENIVIIHDPAIAALYLDEVEVVYQNAQP